MVPFNKGTLSTDTLLRRADGRHTLSFTSRKIPITQLKDTSSNSSYPCALSPS
ncbi:hypothetical protein K435DRAFT_783720 [Dendrothele bispora CBS 962.96]|uniref:Uncharacterized protein n=1 Tax=Dendrothele bispora (strain CBS 962.96) TaxID=1314807 RepID=A0A4V4HCT3_DENBC|nr:hypothetical protein K435DRAFT_783720 [Dendrothele bispora CBS 962.96]